MGVKIRKKALKNGRVSLYLDVYHKGKRSYEFLDLYLTSDKKKNRETERLAEAIRSKREVQLYNNRYDFEASEEDLFFTDFMESITNDKQNPGDKNTPTVLRHIREYDKYNVRFDELTGSWLDGFKSYLLSKVKKSTARTYFLILQSILSKAVTRGVIKVNPIVKNEIKNIDKDPAKINYLTDKELKSLWKTPCKHPEVRRAFLFSAYTGLRLSDILNLRWSDIQHIHDEKNGEDFKQLEIQQKKTGEYVHIPINKTAETLLDVPHRTSKHVFDVTNGIIRYWLPIWREQANIEKHIHFHMARHTFATRLLRRGVDIYTVKELMGHDSVSSTEKYLHLVNADKKNAIDKL